MPRQTGQTLVLGGSPKWLGQAQNILLAVESSTCISKPIVGLYARDVEFCWFIILYQPQIITDCKKKKYRKDI